MKAICTVSHEKPIDYDRFIRYIAGQQYDLNEDEFDEAYFVPLNDTQGGDKE